MIVLVLGLATLFLLYYPYLYNTTSKPSFTVSTNTAHAVFDYYQRDLSVDESELFLNPQTLQLHSFGNYSFNQYDYRDIRYPIPFSQYYQSIEARYKGFGVADSILSRVNTGRILPSTNQSAVMLVIGSDTRQFHSMVFTIANAFQKYPFAALTIIDYGLTDQDKQDLQKSLDCSHLLNEIPVYYRMFNFNTSPTWISLAECAIKGGYSWKVISYLDAVFQWKGMALWLDTGLMIEDTIAKDIEFARKEGFYSPKSYDPIEKWISPDSLEFLNRYFIPSPLAVNETNCLSAYVFVDPRNQTILRKVLYPYYQCAFTRRCIQPLGASRSNHRSEQSILSLLVKSISIPHTASTLSGRRPPMRQNRKKRDLNGICCFVCFK